MSKTPTRIPTDRQPYSSITVTPEAYGIVYSLPVWANRSLFVRTALKDSRRLHVIAGRVHSHRKEYDKRVLINSAKIIEFYRRHIK